MKNQSNKSSERSARHIFACSLLVAGCGVFATGCAGDDAGNDMPDGEGQFSVSVGALSPGDIADACYALTATNEAGDVVWTQPNVCGSDYGFAANISYIGICDATEPNHTVTLELNSLVDGDGLAIADTEYVNPCPVGIGCSQNVLCEENADVLVDFDLTILLDADTGFVDVSVDVDYLECSAKLDCIDDEGNPLLLLHDANGERGQTVVMAFACTTESCLEPGADMYFSDVTITCAEGTATLSPVGPGAVPFTQDAPIVFGATVYTGQGPFGTTFYNNLAIGFLGGTDCLLNSAATASDTPFPGGVTTPQHPVLSWDVALTDGAGELVCTRHALDGGAPGVETVYPGSVTFPNVVSFPTPLDECGPVEPCDGVICDPGFTCDANDGLCVPDVGPDLCDDVVCASEEICVEGTCVGSASNGLRFTLVWDESTDIDLHVDTPVPSAIYYDNTSADGCTLDTDNTTGGASSVENINCQLLDPAFFGGTFSVWATNFSASVDTAYVLEIFADGVLVNSISETVPASLGNPDPHEGGIYARGTVLTFSYP